MSADLNGYFSGGHASASTLPSLLMSGAIINFSLSGGSEDDEYDRRSNALELDDCLGRLLVISQEIFDRFWVPVSPLFLLCHSLAVHHVTNFPRTESQNCDGFPSVTSVHHKQSPNKTRETARGSSVTWRYRSSFSATYRFHLTTLTKRSVQVVTTSVLVVNTALGDLNPNG